MDFKHKKTKSANSSQPQLPTANTYQFKNRMLKPHVNSLQKAVTYFGHSTLTLQPKLTDQSQDIGSLKIPDTIAAQTLATSHVWRTPLTIPSKVIQN